MKTKKTNPKKQRQSDYELTFDEFCKNIDKHKEEIDEEIEEDIKKNLRAWENAGNHWVY